MSTRKRNKKRTSAFHIWHVLSALWTFVPNDLTFWEVYLIYWQIYLVWNDKNNKNVSRYNVHHNNQRSSMNTSLTVSFKTECTVMIFVKVDFFKNNLWHWISSNCANLANELPMITLGAAIYRLELQQCGFTFQDLNLSLSRSLSHGTSTNRKFTKGIQQT